MAVVERIEGIQGGLGVKAPVRVATTANIALTGLQTIDTVALAGDDRVLVKDQDDASENGIYNASSGVWQRSKDFDGVRDVVDGTRVYVTDGTGGSQEYAVTSANPLVIGTSDIEFAVSGGAGSGGVQPTRTIATATGLTGGGDLSANRTIALDINALSADNAPDKAADYVLSYDASASTHKKVLIGGLSDDKALATRTISAGSGLSGGGDLSANRTLTLDINSLTEDLTPAPNDDFVPTYDASAGALRKVKLSNVTAVTSVHGRTGDVVAVSGDYDAVAIPYDNGVSGFTSTNTQAVVDEIKTTLDAKAPTSRLIVAGSGLTGGGSLAADRTLAVSVTGLTTDSSPDGAADYVLTFDASAGANKKVLLNNLPNASGGETNTASNVGAGSEVFKQKTGVDLEFRTLVGGTNVTITEGDDDITISQTAGGEANTASNVGGGEGVYKQKTSLDLEFKSLVAGSGISLTGNDDDITIASSYGSSLSALNGVTPAADRLPYFTGASAASLATFTAAGRAILDDADATAQRATLGLVIGTDVQAYDADTLKADVADVLTAGFAATPFSAGTKSSGTFTPDEANGNFQYAVNGGAHTLAPPTNNCTIVIQYTNNASAGAITTSGFTKVDGDTLTTTNGHDFFFCIIKCNGFSTLTVKALQ